MEIMKRYVKHLDELRKDNNIRTEKFIEDVCSPRQWTRYKSGENIIPGDKLSLLVHKLGMTINDFDFSFAHNDNNELEPTEEVNELIHHRKFDEARAVLNQYKDHTFISKKSEIHHKYLILLVDYFDNRIPDHYMLDKLSSLIDYPNCLKKKYHSFTDFLVINRICEIEIKHKKTTALDFLYGVVYNPQSIYVSGQKRNYLAQFYYVVAKGFWNIGNNEKALEVCNEGIQYSVQFNRPISLEKMYYLKSYILDLMHRPDEAYNAAVQCIATCIAKNNFTKVKFYNDFFLEEQGYTIDIPFKKPNNE